MFAEVLTKTLIMKITVNKKLSVMKVFLFMCLISLAPLQAQNLDKVKKTASIDFETETLDYGTIEQNSNGERIFTFTNSGDAPLIISNVKASCGCTVPTYSKEAILPGKEGEIKIKYDTKRMGSFTKTITVHSNAYQSRKTLKIKGTIVSAD